MTRESSPVAGLRIAVHKGPRDRLRPLFELAEDSGRQLDSYFSAGQVLVALSGVQVIGHLQLVQNAHPGEFEIKSMAVLVTHQRRGVGAMLVRAGLALATDGSASVVIVATAAADVGNLRFYQRQGFRLRSVERDAFTPETGYPDDIVIDGIRLRDRVWLDHHLPP